MRRPAKPKTASRSARSKGNESTVIAGLSLKSSNQPVKSIGVRLKGTSQGVASSVLRQHLPATQAKNLFGKLIKDASSGPIFIERHGKPQVVLVDFKTYKDLVETKRTPDEKRLESLRAEFDTLYVQMQTPAVRKVADDFLSASAEELNKVARRHKHRG
jgi:prevent-host-death family protein